MILNIIKVLSLCLLETVLALVEFQPRGTRGSKFFAISVICLLTRGRRGASATAEKMFIAIVSVEMEIRVQVLLNTFVMPKTENRQT